MGIASDPIGVGSDCRQNQVAMSAFAKCGLHCVGGWLLLAFLMCVFETMKSGECFLILRT